MPISIETPVLVVLPTIRQWCDNRTEYWYGQERPGDFAPIPSSIAPVAVDRVVRLSHHHAMETPAHLVIRLFGGPRKTARKLGITHPWVIRWDRPRDEGGSGGSIPASHFGKILEVAKSEGISLTADELIFGRK